ncbi:SDR family NAD(P)-dependent oxidoreductase [Gordonia sp. CPCC 205515]|uniref:SDR family NAD(P)-dependent oxidoreductase n=1 Tax=Gordonia sp. CPCC 205515 TaxID=3140791 RepID=UPI003AF3EA4A
MTDLFKYGPWAVIAGGSEGVGASFARQLAQAGVHLVLIARKPEPLDATAETARAFGVQVRTLALDLTRRDSIDTIVAATDDLDVGLLIYNAGANSYGSGFLDGDLGRFHDVIDLNITTQLALVQHFGRQMRDAGRGGILLVGSMSGYLGAAELSVYSGVKAFGRIFAESLWLELREYGVDVCELILGVTRTPAMQRAGLNFDVPGMLVSEHDDVAREGLEHLGDGPVWIAGGNARQVEKRNGSDRAALVLGAHEAMQRMLARR